MIYYDYNSETYSVSEESNINETIENLDNEEEYDAFLRDLYEDSIMVI